MIKNIIKCLNCGNEINNRTRNQVACGSKKIKYSCAWERQRVSSNKAKMKFYNSMSQLERKNYNRTLKIGRKFKIDNLVFEDMVRKQNNLCAICGEKEIVEDRCLSIDHCHKTGKVRGLLCRTCNSGIGFLKDDIYLLKKAIKYLKNYE